MHLESISFCSSLLLVCCQKEHSVDLSQPLSTAVHCLTSLSETLTKSLLYALISHHNTVIHRLKIPCLQHPFFHQLASPRPQKTANNSSEKRNRERAARWKAARKALNDENKIPVIPRVSLESPVRTPEETINMLDGMFPARRSEKKNQFQGS